MEGRCRSCKEDTECQSYYGVGKCTVVADVPGYPKSAVCRPTTTRRPRGSACTEDAQCEFLFCDRGTCENSEYPAAYRYGEECKPEPPKAVPDFLRGIAPPGGRCDGYLCIEGRCRSCKEDAECQEGSSDLKCLDASGLPGKMCITLREAEYYRHQVVVPSKAPTIDLDAGPVRVVPRVSPAPRSPSQCP